jgi:hypothetical protein
MKTSGRHVILFFILYFVFCTSLLLAQHPWQKPALRSHSAIEKIIGPLQQTQPSRQLTIIWVWGVDYDHERGYHEYPWVMDLYVNQLLSKIPRLDINHVMYFPTKEQWENADLVVFYHHAFDTWGKPEYELVDAYQARGGGLLFIHESVIQRPGNQLARRIGLAWDVDASGEDQSGWGVMPTPLSLTALGDNHTIFAGFSKKIDLIDEFYWNLHDGQCQLNTLVTSPAGRGGDSDGPPRSDQLDNQKWPVFWTLEKGNGRVFVSVPGHNYFTFNDPYFRIILLRAMAWTMRESFEPFKFLVYEGLNLE